MFNIPIALGLIPYALILVFFLVFSVVDVYHLIHYGEATKVSYAVTVVFFFVSAIIMLLTLYLLRDVNWSTSFSFLLPFFGPLPPPTF
jgi:hypothetical protein